MQSSKTHKTTNVAAVTVESFRFWWWAGGPWDVSSSGVPGLRAAGCRGADQAETEGREVAALHGCEPSGVGPVEHASFRGPAFT